MELDTNRAPARSTAAAKARVHRRPNYWLVFFALATMTILEVAVTYQSALPHAPLLLGMSFLKAMLVVLYFMHLRFDSRWFSLVFFAPFALVIPLLLVIRQ